MIGDRPGKPVTTFFTPCCACASLVLFVILGTGTIAKYTKTLFTESCVGWLVHASLFLTHVASVFRFTLVQTLVIKCFFAFHTIVRPPKPRRQRVESVVVFSVLQQTYITHWDIVNMVNQFAFIQQRDTPLLGINND